MFRRLDQPGVDFLATLPSPLAAELQDALGEPFVVEGVWRGGWSDCFLLAMGSRRKLVLKRPWRPNPIGDEIVRLERAREAGLAARRVVPELYARLADGTAYLADYIPGENVSMLLRRGVRPGLGDEVARALLEYHAAMDEALGDFNPGNVVVRNDGVTFVDPGDREKHPAYAGEPILAADLGRWLAFTASSLPVSLARRPRQGLRRTRLTIDVIAAALANDPDGDKLTRAIEAASVRQLKSWMPHASMRRDRLAYRPACLLVQVIGFVVRRRLSRRRNP